MRPDPPGGPSRVAREGAEVGHLAAVQEALSELPEGSAARTRLAALAEDFDFDGLVEAAREMEEGAPS